MYQIKINWQWHEIVPFGNKHAAIDSLMSTVEATYPAAQAFTMY